MEKVYRGFVSSISGEGLLNGFRDIVKEKMINNDTLPVMMEHNFHGLHGELPVETDISRMDCCDYFIFIIEVFGGSIIKDAIVKPYHNGCKYKDRHILSLCDGCNGKYCSLTYVQFEYQHAKLSEKPIVVLLHEDCINEDEKIDYTSYIETSVARVEKGRRDKVSRLLNNQISSLEVTRQQEFVNIIKTAGNIIKYAQKEFSQKCDEALSKISKTLDKPEYFNLGALRYNDWLHNGLDEENEYVHLEHLGYNSENGEVLNFARGSNERQVVLRARTFNNLLDFIWEYIISEKHVEGDEMVKSSFYKSMLFSCGRKCGWDFADRNFDNFKKANRNDIKGYLEDWFKFDTQVGFGKILLNECNTGKDENGEKKLECIITIENNFSVEGEAFSERCCFIRGYFEGALKKFARKLHYGDRCKVIIDCIANEDCQRIGHGGKKCVYIATASSAVSPEKNKWKITELSNQEVQS